MSDLIECANCGLSVHYSLDHRRWLHNEGRTYYCVANFDATHSPTTHAEPVRAGTIYEIYEGQR